MKKRTQAAGSIVLAALLIIPLALIITAVVLPSKYAQSYYAELGEMYGKLKTSSGKKIVIVGNSNVAFGVYSDYLELMLSESGEDYTVCNFGLYGTIGTKVMLDLSENYISEGDIVLFCPEPYPQTMSLYYSGSEMWRALDTKLSMASELDKKSVSSLVGNFAGYVAEKYSLAHSEGEMASGVYAKKAFEDNCDMTKAERIYNQFAEGYDVNNKISLGENLLNDDFTAYVNSYYKKVKKAGAKMYFSLCPVNRLSINNTDEEIDKFCASAVEKFGFPMLGNPHNYVLDHEWFYDSNFHLNYSGMYVRTIQLYKDLIITEFNKIPKSYSLPEKPVRDEVEITEGDDSDLACFTYEYIDDREGYRITGLSAEGASRTELVIPTKYESVPIIGYDVSTFQNATHLAKLTVQENIPILYDNSFTGCSSLRQIILKQTNPNKIATGYGVLEGTADCYFYVDRSGYVAFCGHYTWGHLAKHIKPLD